MNSSVPVTGFEFTISNGTVTGMERVFGNKTIDLRIPSNATFSVGDSTVTETITGTLGNEVLQFVQDAGNTSLYHLASDTVTIANPTTTYDNGRTFGYAFTISDGSVTGEQITSGDATHTHTRTVSIPSTASFTVDGDTVTETIVLGNVVESIEFVASGTAGLYAVASDTRTLIQAGSSATALFVNPCNRAEFTIDSSGNVSQVQAVLKDGTLKQITTDASTTYTQPEAGYVIETQTHGRHTSYEVYHDGNGDGIYTEIAHGSGSTVDLVGLKAQLTSTIEAVL